MKKVSLSCIILLVVGTAYFLLCFDTAQISSQFIPPEGTVPLYISKETVMTMLDQHSSVNADSEENGFRDIVRFLGRKIFKEISDEKWKILCDKLNLPPEEPPCFHYLPLRDFIYDFLEKSKGKRAQFNGCGERIYEDLLWKRTLNIYYSFDIQEGVPAENFEILKYWCQEMEPAISVVSEVLKKSTYVIPPTGRLELSDLSASDWPDFVPCIMAHREIIEMFSYRYLSRQIEYDLRGCWDDILAMFRIARHFGKQPWPDALKFAIAFEKKAVFFKTHFLNVGKFDASECCQYLSDLDLLPGRSTFENYLEYTRLGWLKNISEFPQKGPVVFGYSLIALDHPILPEENKKAFQKINSEIEKAIKIYHEVSFNWNIVAEIMNAEFDERRGKLTKQTIFQSNSALRTLYEEIKVRELFLNELSAIIKNGMLEEIVDFTINNADENLDIEHLKKMSIEERSVYLGKVFSQLAILLTIE